MMANFDDLKAESAPVAILATLCSLAIFAKYRARRSIPNVALGSYHRPNRALRRTSQVGYIADQTKGKADIPIVGGIAGLIDHTAEGPRLSKTGHWDHFPTDPSFAKPINGSNEFAQIFFGFRLREDKPEGAAST
jgi:hypothetical protein